MPSLSSTSFSSSLEETDFGNVLGAEGRQQIDHRGHIKALEDMGECLRLPKKENNTAKGLEIGLLASTEALGVIMEAAGALAGESALDCVLTTMVAVLTSLLCLL